jgi:hypothetical protein
MSDLLAAASLLLAVVAIIFSVWYGEISNALNLTKPVGDTVAFDKKIKEVLWNKAIPLFLVSVLIAAVFIPDVWSIVSEAVTMTWKYPRNAWQDYNSVKGAFCVVILLLLGFSVYSGMLAIRLWRR